MRVLHPITPRETLVASGTYRYRRAGDPVPGDEHFSIHALADGSWFVRVDYDWRALDGTSQLVEALIDPLDAGGRFQRVVAQLHSPSGVARETVDFHANRVLIGVGGAGESRQDVEIPLPTGYAVLLLKTTLAGIGAARWPAAPGQHVPVFAGYRSDRSAALTFNSVLREVGREPVAVGAQSFDARVVELSGEFAQTLWLDSSGIAVRRVMGEVSVSLHNYSRGVRAGV